MQSKQNIIAEVIWRPIYSTPLLQYHQGDAYLLSLYNIGDQYLRLVYITNKQKVPISSKYQNNFTLTAGDHYLRRQQLKKEMTHLPALMAWLDFQ